MGKPACIDFRVARILPTFYSHGTWLDATHDIIMKKKQKNNNKGLPFPSHAPKQYTIILWFLLLKTSSRDWMKGTAIKVFRLQRKTL